MKLRRIEGIYNQEIVRQLLQIGIKSWLFDFRPKSFSFIPQYKFFEILKQYGQLSEEIFMLFSREKSETLESFLDIVLKESKEHSITGKIKLEFDDFIDSNLFDRFELPYYLRIKTTKDLLQLTEKKYLEGLVFTFDFMSELQDKDELPFLSQTLLDLINRLPHIKMFLAADWDSNLFPSLEEYFPFLQLSMPINSKVESSYRVLDEKLFHSNTHYFLKDKNEHIA